MSVARHPLDSAAFETAMAAFGPFEASPRLALAVSGGADSMALAWLAAAWLRAHDGQGVALVVDHRLRSESGEEAATVALRCRALGLEAQVLTRGGEATTGGIEEAARAARYALLELACRRHGCLHLLTAHHGDDQAETIAMRRETASGPLGLAGMSACVERGGLRLLRPLLGFPRERLRATVRAAGLGWVEDPMNGDPRFARSRLRRDGFAPTPADPARMRLEIEHRLVRALPGLVALDRFGVARMDRAAWRALPADLRDPALARIALAVGGGSYAPAAQAMIGLGARLDGENPTVATLGGCLWRAGHAHVTVSREARNLPGRLRLAPGEPFLWDGRFHMQGDAEGLDVLPVAALAQRDRGAIVPLRRALGLSAAESAPLPAILDLEGLLAVPHLGYVRQGRDTAPVTVAFAPRHALSPVPFVAARSG